jgi:hypothetical protein
VPVTGVAEVALGVHSGTTLTDVCLARVLKLAQSLTLVTFVTAVVTVAVTAERPGAGGKFGSARESGGSVPRDESDAESGAECENSSADDRGDGEGLTRFGRLCDRYFGGGFCGSVVAALFRECHVRHFLSLCRCDNNDIRPRCLTVAMNKPCVA